MNPEQNKHFNEENIFQIDVPLITPDSLLESNKSSEADERRYIWEEARRNGELSVIWGCGDARLILPYSKNIHVRSIATSGPREPFTRLINHKGVKNVVVMAHHDGETVLPHKIPSGCGGLTAKADTLSNYNDQELNGIGRFVDEEIHHPDLIRQAFESAFITSVHTEKPVLAATQDHLSGTIYPLAAFWDGGKRIVSAFPLRNMREDYYDPGQIYADGIPFLTENEIPDTFSDFLFENTKQIINLHDKYRNLHKNQKVQNPYVVSINAGIRPYGVTQPNLEDPNLNFQLSVARDRIDQTIHITDKVIETTFEQTEYPIAHATKNFGQLDKPFSNVNTVLIETPDIDQSVRIAGKLSEKNWMREWLSLQNHQIIVSQKQAGIVSQIEVI